ncbi:MULTISPECIES: minor capsid protein [unclassified Streptococcus]|uniref:minor capsid protein n=1 Tax=unclassified Streptococcus TaxID=2608887 RepID=UPI001071FF36|nr:MULTISPECIES: minor capsid protein [unclassified Streptococcus]MBF0788165.1 minor capsid protein [Streptococcus sp. 19428wC2_LYSM12]MCQ9212282.1 minor capsid protein [Streptococcus sp. B01]MCQ9213613.1 minor capsid protein [Streptococcus sp. O1]TFV04766.1 capsid protein [Streptococcus sp. LYSM12]
MSIRIKVDMSNIKSKLSNQSIRRGKLAMANQMLMDMTNFVPMANESGALRASGHVIENGNAVEWNTVYARAQFYGTNGIVTFQHYSTPGTGKRWDEKAKAIHMTDWKDKFVKGAGL